MRKSDVDEMWKNYKVLFWLVLNFTQAVSLKIKTEWELDKHNSRI